jgi:hypothetical protein
MSIDIHPGAQQAVHALPDAVEDRLGQDASWAETTITVLATIITIVFVSIVAVLMAMA